MIVSAPGYTTTTKLGSELQNGDVIVSDDGILMEVYEVLDPSPGNKDLVKVVTNMGDLISIKGFDYQYTVMDDASLNAYYN